MSLNALLEEYYAEQGYDINVVNNFYYDETNKSSVKTEMIFDKIAYKFEHSKKRIKN